MVCRLIPCRGGRPRWMAGRHWADRRQRMVHTGQVQAHCRGQSPCPLPFVCVLLWSRLAVRIQGTDHNLVERALSRQPCGGPATTDYHKGSVSRWKGSFPAVCQGKAHQSCDQVGKTRMVGKCPSSSPRWVEGVLDHRLPLRSYHNNQ